MYTSICFCKAPVLNYALVAIVAWHAVHAELTPANAVTGMQGSDGS